MPDMGPDAQSLRLVSASWAFPFVVDAYLSRCDNLSVSGEASYKDKRQETEILESVARFERFRDEHNDLCDCSNRSLISFQLIPRRKIYAGTMDSHRASPSHLPIASDRFINS